jgi:hypothetical protein
MLHEPIRCCLLWWEKQTLHNSVSVTDIKHDTSYNLKLDNRGIVGLLTAGREVYCSSKNRDRLCGFLSASHLMRNFGGGGGRETSCVDVKLSTYFHFVPTLGMSGGKHFLPYTLSWLEHGQLNILSHIGCFLQKKDIRSRLHTWRTYCKNVDSGYLILNAEWCGDILNMVVLLWFGTAGILSTSVRWIMETNRPYTKNSLGRK